ncbi:MAG: transcriptional regulator CynR [Sulfuritalea sp.]|nr:transcriptional regulator CynR [Sulfuritalea sp.]
MHSRLMFPRSIRYLLAVAEHQSFTRAAEALYVSQPTLSQQIKQLEEALGVQLLDRSGRTVRLTDAGEVYLRHARRALEELDAGKRAVSEVEDLSRGFLRLGMTPVTEYLTTSLLDEFGGRYPGIMVSAMEMSQDHIEAGVAENNIDVGIAFTHTPSTDAWSSKIEMHTLFMEPLSLAVGNAHPFAGRQTPLGMDVFEREPLVMLNPDFALRRHFDLYCLENGITPRIVIETNSLSMIVQSVSLGRLVTVLPTTIACTQSGLFAVPLLPELPHHTIALICSKGAYKSPACRAFGNLASEWNFGRCPVTPATRSKPCPRPELCNREKRTFADDVESFAAGELAAVK